MMGTAAHTWPSHIRKVGKWEQRQVKKFSPRLGSSTSLISVFLRWLPLIYPLFCNTNIRILEIQPLQNTYKSDYTKGIRTTSNPCFCEWGHPPKSSLLEKFPHSVLKLIRNPQYLSLKGCFYYRRNSLYKSSGPPPPASVSDRHQMTNFEGHGDMIFIQTQARHSVPRPARFKIHPNFNCSNIRKNHNFYLNRHEGFSPKIPIFIRIRTRDGRPFAGSLQLQIYCGVVGYCK